MSIIGRRRTAFALSSAVIAVGAATGCSGPGTSGAQHPPGGGATLTQPAPPAVTMAAGSLLPSPVLPAEGTSVSATPGSGPTTVTGTTTPADPQAGLKGAALAVVPLYYAASDRIDGDPAHANAADFYHVSMSPQTSYDLRTLNDYRDSGSHLQGTTTIASSTATAISLVFAPRAVPPTYPFVTAAVCIDVSAAHAVDDKTGKVLGVSDRPNYYREQVTITNPSWPATRGWKVSAITNSPATSCAS